MEHVTQPDQGLLPPPLGWQRPGGVLSALRLAGARSAHTEPAPFSTQLLFSQVSIFSSPDWNAVFNAL